jgi:transcriptional regulator with XRE-family HTH domain
LAGRQRERSGGGQVRRVPTYTHRKARPETLDILAVNIRALRKALGWSQDACADQAGLNRSYIGDIERRKHNPRLSTLEALADAFRVRVGDLLTPTAEKLERDEK